MSDRRREILVDAAGFARKQAVAHLDAGRRDHARGYATVWVHYLRAAGAPLHTPDRPASDPAGEP